MPEPEMTPAMYGLDITFAGVPRAPLPELPEPDIVFVGARAHDHEWFWLL